MARFRATVDGPVPLTAAQETQRDAEETAWASRPIKTRGDLLEDNIKSNDSVLAIVRQIAADKGITENDLIAALKSRV